MNKDEERRERAKESLVRDFLGVLTTWGGKGKDEVIKILGREIGQAAAAILKEPLNQIIGERKLQITLELIPKGSKKERAISVTTKKKRHP